MADTNFTDKTDEEIKELRKRDYALARIAGYSAEAARRLRDWRNITKACDNKIWWLK